MTADADRGVEDPAERRVQNGPAEAVMEMREEQANPDEQESEAYRDKTEPAHGSWATAREKFDGGFLYSVLFAAPTIVMGPNAGALARRSYGFVDF